MKKTIDQHIDNLLATVPGLEQQLMQNAANTIVGQIKAKCAAEKQPMPQTVVVTQEQCLTLARESLKGAIGVIAAVLDYESSDHAPAGAGGATVARDGGGEGKEAGVKNIAPPGPTSAVGGEK